MLAHLACSKAIVTAPAHAFLETIRIRYILLLYYYTDTGVKTRAESRGACDQNLQGGRFHDQLFY